MNRPEKSPEPSMEDILASIRRIISDEDRDVSAGSLTSPAASHSRSEEAIASKPSGIMPPRQPQPAARVSTPIVPPAEDEVYTLTDELIFPEGEEPIDDLHYVTEALAKAPTASEPKIAMPEIRPAPQAETAQSVGADEAEESPFIHPLIKLRAEAAAREQEQGKSQDEAAKQTPQASLSQAPRPIWSRREMPQFSPSAPQPKNAADTASAGQTGSTAQTEAVRPMPVSIVQDRETAKVNAGGAAASPSKGWMEDIHLPVPDEGPVSLLGMPPQARTASPSHAPTAPRFEAVIANDQAQLKSAPAPEEVAVLAQSLAKSAVISMQDEELAEAQTFDFARLDDAQRTSVSETFVDALGYAQFETAEVHRTPASAAVSVGERTEVETEDHRGQDHDHDGGIREDDNHIDAADQESERHQAAPVAQLHEELSPKTPAFTPKAEPFQPSGPVVSQAPFAPSVSNISYETPPYSPSSPSAQMSPAVQAPVVQAQFLGQSNAMVSAGSRSLEDSVREMLRPMLVQWLNEHMPRILENAIREEIASRGLGFGGSSEPDKK